MVEISAIRETTIQKINQPRLSSVNYINRSPRDITDFNKGRKSIIITCIIILRNFLKTTSYGEFTVLSINMFTRGLKNDSLKFFTELISKQRLNKSSR